MLALAFGGQSSLRSRFQRHALNAGCRTFVERTDAWVGGCFPSLATPSGARWLDGSLDVTYDAGELLLACAAPTERPLFIHRTSLGVIGSSSLALLVDVLGARISASGLAACILAMGLPDRVPFDAIERVSGGTTWRFSGAHWPRVEEASYRPPAEAPETVEAAARTLQMAIHSAVGRLVEKSRTIGVFMSGGLDSSAVLASLAEHVTTDRIVGVSWALDERHGDRPFVDAWSRRLGVHVHYVTSTDCAPWVRESLTLGAAPMALMTGAFERAAMHRAREHGADVMLTGVGGDESFAGALQAAICDGASLPEQARRSLLAELPWGGTLSGRLAELWLRPRIRSLVPRRVREALFVRHVLRQQPVSTTALTRRLWDAARLHVRAASRVPATAAERWIEGTRRPFWVEMGELRRQLEAAANIPRFDVPLDAELHHVLASIPPRFLFDESRYRGLLRRVLQTRAPQIVTSRSDKADFDAFVLKMLHQAHIGSEWAELARMPRLANLGLAPRGGLGAWSVPTTPEGLDRLLAEWTFLSAESFVRSFS